MSNEKNLNDDPAIKALTGEQEKQVEAFAEAMAEEPNVKGPEQPEAPVNLSLSYDDNKRLVKATVWNSAGSAFRTEKVKGQVTVESMREARDKAITEAAGALALLIG